MVTSADETELKFDAQPGTPLPDLSGLRHVAAVQRAETEELEAEYFDTADLRLLTAGVTLRRRTGGHDSGWHLKLPAGQDTRREIGVPLGRQGEAVPRELADRVAVYARGRPVRPVARLSTTRRLLILRDADGGSLAEVAADDVRATRFDGRDAAAPGRGAVMEWREIEVELTGGDRALLDAAGELLRSSGLQPSASQAKLGRALGVAARRQVAAAQPSASSTAGEAVLAYLTAQALRLRSLDSMVRTDQPDAVHQMRVTCRRMRSALQAFRTVIDPRGTAHMSAELRWLGGQLGAARDAEVLAGRLLSDLAELPAEVVVGPVSARVAGHFASAMTAAKVSLVEALSSARYFALLDEIDAILAMPVLTGTAAGKADDVLSAAVWRAYRRTRKQMRRARRTPQGAAKDRALHEARKAAKRARYAAEAAAPAIGDEAGMFARRMKDVQSQLGDHQDSVVARQVERELGISAHLAGENAFTYGVMYGSELMRADDSSTRAAIAWKRVSQRRCTGWMRQ